MSAPRTSTQFIADHELDGYTVSFRHGVTVRVGRGGLSASASSTLGEVDAANKAVAALLEAEGVTPEPEVVVPAAPAVPVVPAPTKKDDLPPPPGDKE